MNEFNSSPDVPLHIPLLLSMDMKNHKYNNHDILYINYCRKPLKIPNTNAESYFLAVLN